MPELIVTYLPEYNVVMYFDETKDISYNYWINDDEWDIVDAKGLITKIYTDKQKKLLNSNIRITGGVTLQDSP